MYYSNQHNYDLERKENYTLYITSIGSEADKVLNKIFVRFCLLNPKIKKSKLGNMNATKYSFVFNDEAARTIMRDNIRHIIRQEFHNVRMLSENSKNWYVISNIIYN